MPFIAQLCSYLPKLEMYQTDSALIREKHDPILLANLITVVKTVVKNKQNDWEITFAELSQIQSQCTTFSNPLLTEMVMKEIFSLCESMIAERKNLVFTLLDFICECKVVRDLKRLNIDSYHPDIFNALRFILGSADIITLIRQTDLDKLFSAIKGAKIFAETDLRAWSTSTANTLEALFKGLIISENTVELKRFEAGTYKMDPLVLERLQRRSLYIKANSAPNSPTRPMTPLSRNAHSLPNTPKKDEVEATVPPLLLSGVAQVSSLTRTREDTKAVSPQETSARAKNKPIL
jgi:hypothetical protein